MERREFFKKGLLASIYGLALAAVSYPAIVFITFRRSSKIEVVFEPQDQGPDIRYKEGVYLLKNGDELKAVSARCTHLGCLVNYNPISRRFECPCHGSVYDATGKRIAGPASKDLLAVPLNRSPDGTITVTIEIQA
ncbi:MAG: hypothetical protein C4582_01580 [Desulfobacteraceae bacterium]|jgi:cytochrome b6-f complex iron-sulfur subunit|nr:MAG: hypothetical protein C4582_01580 [Desulfobacteraceae bacterium]